MQRWPESIGKGAGIRDINGEVTPWLITSSTTSSSAQEQPDASAGQPADCWDPGASLLIEAGRRTTHH